MVVLQGALGVAVPSDELVAIDGNTKLSGSGCTSCSVVP